MGGLDERKVHRFFESAVASEKLQQYLDTGDCYPFVAILHLTMACNHRCDFCNYYHVMDQRFGRGTASGRRVTTAHALQLLNELRECGVHSLIFSGGGEPLLHPEFARIARCALECGLCTSLYTNLDVPLQRDALVVMQAFDSVTVNINTSNPELYTATRGDGANFERVERNLGLLAEVGANVEAVVIVRDNTAPGLRDTIAWLEQRSASRIKVASAFELRYGDGLGATEATIRETMVVASDCRRGSKLKVLGPVEASLRDESGHVICRTSVFDITIGADYTIYPCCMTAYMDGYGIVDLGKYRSFREAWSSPERRRWRQGAQVACATCWFAPANRCLIAMETGEKT